jgi:superfamily II DNA/RNA helicase
VEGISHVINYDVPSFAEDYIHRIGRTGMATAKGDAITFVSRDEEKYLHQIEKFIGKKFKFEKCEGFVPATPEPKQQQQQEHAHHFQHHHEHHEHKKEHSPADKGKKFPFWRRKKH